jgi:hypothetical protein
MINQQPGTYALSSEDMIALKKAGVSDKVLAAMIVRNGSDVPAAAPAEPPPPVTVQPVTPAVLALHDATPIRLRLNRNVTSADAKAGDTVDFEILDDLTIDGVLVIARGGTAIGTITEAEQKKRMARGGKLGFNIDYVRLLNGSKVALRAVKQGKGGGHTGAMTGAMVATAVVFWPAAPFFLFMHGKDVTFPKGTEITAYVEGEIKLERSTFVPGGAPSLPPAAVSPRAAPAASNPMPPASPGTPSGLVDIAFTSNLPGALVSMYGAPIGRTPFTTRLAPGTYKAVFSAEGHYDLTQSVSVGLGYSNSAHAEFELKP